MPQRGGVGPDEPVEVLGVAAVAQLAAWGGEVVLVPPAVFGLRCQGCEVGLEVDDDVAADGDESGAPLGPQRSDDIGGTPAPVVPAEDRARDV